MGNYQQFLNYLGREVSRAYNETFDMQIRSTHARAKSWGKRAKRRRRARTEFRATWAAEEAARDMEALCLEGECVLCGGEVDLAHHYLNTHEDDVICDHCGVRRME